MTALERARKILDDAGVKYSVHMLVGKPWEVISEYVRVNHCDHIVMGTRGLGSCRRFLSARWRIRCGAAQPGARPHSEVTAACGAAEKSRTHRRGEIGGPF